MNKFFKVLGLFALVINLNSCINVPEPLPTNENSLSYDQSFDLFNFNFIPEYNNDPYVEINNGKTFFIKDNMTDRSYEHYSELDYLGRTGIATACLGPETLPNEKRGPIGMIKPAGWHTVKYPDVIKDLYLYNRCHLIAFELSGENANEKNLTTGTRYMNVSGMLPFENKTRKYIDETNNHVMYRVTPVFLNDELICRGILIEAKSVEDDNLEFCVYCYNVQPNITIDYKTGNSHITNKE